MMISNSIERGSAGILKRDAYLAKNSENSVLTSIELLAFRIDIFDVENIFEQYSGHFTLIEIVKRD